MIAISRLGEGQLLDVKKSGAELYTDYFRTCTVLQGEPPTSDIGDNVPYRMAKLFGHDWQYWNRHFVVQVAGCPLACWYCYVDNLKADLRISVTDLVGQFISMRALASDLNVFHLMGGLPGLYCKEWKEIRAELDKQGCEDVLMLTNVVLLEDAYFRKMPWLYIPERCLVSVCLKGMTKSSFITNTGKDMFSAAMRELPHYIGRENCFFQIFEEDEASTRWIIDLVGEDNIDWLRVKEYEVVKMRSASLVVQLWD
ncbi:hypothetical protein LCGC14_1630670 [marine sediment metagenome]|uniref:Radical SAM core domain-containing protein n=1 Tax=marine sediment metagenome TaxID=412755 RepID=A0A0F9I2Y3_9ZZZZ